MCAINRFDTLAKIKADQITDGFQRVDIFSMKEIFYNMINQNELKRISKLEWIDEFEEFDLMMSHYFVSIANKSIKNDSPVMLVTFENLAKDMP